MSVFNSLGSNYDFRFVLKQIFLSGNHNDYRKLVNKLSKHFDGEAFLFYKGREALHQALRAAGLPEDSNIAINGFTCYAVEEAVAKAGYMPSYLDIDTEQLHFSADTLRDAVGRNPAIKAVVIQNTLGYVCDIEAISKVCKENKLVLIEDLAHSFGAKYADGTIAGTVGDFAMLSFGRDKVIDAVSGGALIARKETSQKWMNDLNSNRHQPSARQLFVDHLYPLSTWSVRKTYSVGLGKLKQVFLKKLGLLPRATDGDFDGYTDLPDGYCANVGYIISKLHSSLAHRKKIADIYRQNLNSDMIPEIAKTHASNIELRFPIMVSNRDDLLKYLKQNDIHISDIWYDSPIAPPRFMTKTHYKGECPKAERVSMRLLNLPTHINIDENKAQQICERINEFVKASN